MTGPTADYLVVGAGATAMAFVDTLLAHTTHQILLTDRRDEPGGHWIDAYPFVRLHQPAAYYGVESRQLGQGGIDSDGSNAGNRELASKPEIVDYYHQTLRRTFLPSGRVQWLPRHEYRVGPGGEHLLENLESGATVEVGVHPKVVDTTRSEVRVPATTPPSYSIAEGVAHIPVNELPGQRRPYRIFTVIGAGKTGMDACVWLLEHGVDPGRVRWIVPRDPWVLNRSQLNTAIDTRRLELAQLEAFAEGGTLEDILSRLEQRTVLQRIDPNVTPSAYRCAVLSAGELKLLRRIKDVIRLGHVETIRPGRIEVSKGQVSAHRDTLYIDCSASGIGSVPGIPIFSSDRIVPQPVRSCQPTFSAALIAFVESRFASDTVKNALCAPVLLPHKPADLLSMTLASLSNELAWSRNANVSGWIAGTRLDRVAAMRTGNSDEDQELRAVAKRTREVASVAMKRLPELIAAASGEEERDGTC